MKDFLTIDYLKSLYTRKLKLDFKFLLSSYSLKFLNNLKSHLS